MRLNDVRPFAAALVCLRPSRTRMCPDSIPITCTHSRICARPRRMLQHRPADATVSANEEVAIAEINQATGAITCCGR
jgi:hypothetical protein